MGYAHRKLTYADATRDELFALRVLTDEIERMKVRQEELVLSAWRGGAVLHDIGEAARVEGTRTRRAVWAMRKRDRALLRQKVRTAA